MQGELCLHKQVGGGALPGDKVASIVAAVGVEVEGFVAHTARAVAVGGGEEFGAVKAKFPRVPQRAQGFAPATLLGVVAGKGFDVGKAQRRDDGLVMAGGLALVERAGRHVRHQRHGRKEDFAVEV